MKTKKGYIIPVCYTEGILTFPSRENVIRVLDLRPSELADWIDSLPDYYDSKKGDVSS